MIIYLCDRCRKQLSSKTELAWVVITRPSGINENIGELCHHCSEGLKDFMAPLPTVTTDTEENTSIL